ncbi:MAG: xylose repressor [Acidobacteriaceae bacterium]
MDNVAMEDNIATSRRRTKGIQRIDLAYAELASSEIARDINRDVVLEIIRTKQPISRADLSRISGLQPSTVSSIVEQLLNEQWITEGAAAIRPRGRRPTLLSLNTNMVIAVADVRPTQAIVAVVDLNGRFLSRETLPLLKDPARGVAKIVAAMQRMIKEHPDKSFEGIGLSLPGRVDPETQRLILAPNLPWTDFDIKRALEAKIPLRVEMDNDANACLLSELWFGRMDGVRNAVLVTITEGVGTAILANGQLVTGKGGLAGEFGHISIEPDGPECGCGRKGCWEVFASSRSAISYYAELESSAERPDIMELLNLAEDGDASAIKALSRQAVYLGRGLRNIVAALSPDVIHLNGGLTSSWDRFGPMVEAELAGNVMAGSPPRLAVTTDVELARLRGAAALVLQRHSGYGRATRNGAAAATVEKSKGKAAAIRQKDK